MAKKYYNIDPNWFFSQKDKSKDDDALVIFLLDKLLNKKEEKKEEKKDEKKPKEITTAEAVLWLNFAAIMLGPMYIYYLIKIIH